MSRAHGFYVEAKLRRKVGKSGSELLLMHARRGAASEAGGDDRAAEAPENQDEQPRAASSRSGGSSPDPLRILPFSELRLKMQLQPRPESAATVHGGE